MEKVCDRNVKEISLLKGKVEELTFEDVYSKCAAFINKVASTWYGLPMTREDIRQCCYIGLWKAYKSYDLKCGVSFLTFSKKCMVNEILNHHRIRHGKKYDNEVFTDEIIYNPHYSEMIKRSVEDEYIIKEIYGIINELPEKEKYVICQSLGYMNMTQTQLAKKFNTTQVEISRLKKKVIKKIRDIYLNGGV